VVVGMSSTLEDYLPSLRLILGAGVG